MRHPTLLDHNRFHPLERKEVEVHDPKASVFFLGGMEGSRDLLGCGVCVLKVDKNETKKGRGVG